jgi:hypothetical protein
MSQVSQYSVQVRHSAVWSRTLLIVLLVCWSVTDQLFCNCSVLLCNCSVLFCCCSAPALLLLPYATALCYCPFSALLYIRNVPTAKVDGARLTVCSRLPNMPLISPVGPVGPSWPTRQGASTGHCPEHCFHFPPILAFWHSAGLHKHGACLFADDARGCAITCG